MPHLNSRGVQDLCSADYFTNFVLKLMGVQHLSCACCKEVVRRVESFSPRVSVVVQNHRKGKWLMIRIIIYLLMQLKIQVECIT